LLFTHHIFKPIGVIKADEFEYYIEVLVLIELLNAGVQGLFKVAIENIFHLKVNHDSL
jgi:hypothetical protein